MVRKRRRLIVFLLLCAGCGGGSGGLSLGPGALFVEPGPESPSEASTPGAGRLVPLPTPDVARYRIRTGDVLTISVMGEAEMTRSLPVGQSDDVSMTFHLEYAPTSCAVRLGSSLIRPSLSAASGCSEGRRRQAAA